ncbi:hypothetical protein B5S27_g521 [[Candida] boidinii]|nr:hypothetical protein B5S27_g521 [[Candida] boidinii]
MTSIDKTNISNIRSNLNWNKKDLKQLINVNNVTFDSINENLNSDSPPLGSFVEFSVIHHSENDNSSNSSNINLGIVIKRSLGKLDLNLNNIQIFTIDGKFVEISPNDITINLNEFIRPKIIEDLIESPNNELYEKLQYLMILFISYNNYILNNYLLPTNFIQLNLINKFQNNKQSLSIKLKNFALEIANFDKVKNTSNFFNIYSAYLVSHVIINNDPIHFRFLNNKTLNNLNLPLNNYLSPDKNILNSNYFINPLHLSESLKSICFNKNSLSLSNLKLIFESIFNDKNNTENSKFLFKRKLYENDDLNFLNFLNLLKFFIVYPHPILRNNIKFFLHSLIEIKNETIEELFKDITPVSVHKLLLLLNIYKKNTTNLILSSGLYGELPSGKFEVETLNELYNNDIINLKKNNNNKNGITNNFGNETKPFKHVMEEKRLSLPYEKLLAKIFEDKSYKIDKSFVYSQDQLFDVYKLPLNTKDNEYTEIAISLQKLSPTKFNLIIFKPFISNFLAPDSKLMNSILKSEQVQLSKIFSVSPYKFSPFKIDDSKLGSINMLPQKLVDRLSFSRKRTITTKKKKTDKFSEPSSSSSSSSNGSNNYADRSNFFLDSESAPSVDAIDQYCMKFTIPFDLFNLELLNNPIDLKLELCKLRNLRLITKTDIGNVLNSKPLSKNNNISNINIPSKKESKIIYMVNCIYALLNNRRVLRKANGSLDIEVGDSQNNDYNSVVSVDSISDPDWFLSELNLLINEFLAKYCHENEINFFHRSQIIEKIDPSDINYRFMEKRYFERSFKIMPGFYAYSYDTFLRERSVNKGKLSPTGFISCLQYLNDQNFELINDFSKPLEPFLPLGLKFGYANFTNIFNNLESLINHWQLEKYLIKKSIDEDNFANESLYFSFKKDLLLSNNDYFNKNYSLHQIKYILESLNNSYSELFLKDRRHRVLRSLKNSVLSKTKYANYIKSLNQNNENNDNLNNNEIKLNIELDLESDKNKIFPLKNSISNLYKCIILKPSKFPNLALAYCIDLNINVEIMLPDTHEVRPGDRLVCSEIVYIDSVEDRLVLR